MRFLRTAVAVATVLVPLICAPAASAVPLPPPPYIDHVEWAKWGDLSSLRVYPTPAGRQASTVATDAAVNQAWSEVLALSPDADMPGMWDQFVCHWEFAERGQPGKISWNLEPWRPEVDQTTLLATGCNPGGTEEPF
ncbi:hypothetical protein BST36_09170 [Mycolicibacterium moriokaense]|jgi:hypothetical protein|uniref:DUF2599 domain-containing protein n=1 Tax=Mycolicibacterium moriokaense TaxID=39691 RepID=A0AAD1M9W9_9MYCO|nr:DUF2599 domain-containing protein [Mycolicibacterium moriokaense]MCV7042150.1 DUF2599 domain-containing protein [Mycolicibacterium moriokaense]ORB25212.1 hypothetical protein BST36_09170 [Mycolicibacterium moriokaense]BBX04920.1 hypothetical protein MMOR_58560 [Mycolicibacterium moriokaense]